ncbi:hypothetical protein VTN96DRAFT_5054 [Rasamsonia emersonii]
MRRREPSRITYKRVEYHAREPKPVASRPEEWENTEFLERYREWARSRQLILPEPGEFESGSMMTGDWKVDLRKEFHENGLQVIVKLANIELTPEKPEYEGGSWHVEGQLNEHICATALYYYSNENITPSTLSFRQRADMG